MMTETAPLLTREERQLLAAASRHLREAGWLIDHGNARHPSGIVANWQYPWYLDGKTGRMLQIRCVNGGGWTQRVTLEVDVDCVREAIDHAVAHGLLPQGMSSAYQAGRERGELDATEGWERQWGFKHGRDSQPEPCGLCQGVLQGSLAAGRTPDWDTFSRLVGPWEPAKRPEAATR